MRIFHQRWPDIDGSGSEIALVNEARRKQTPLPGLVEKKRGIVAGVRAGIGALVRRSAQLLLVTPILIIPKLLVPRAVSDAITVGFVIAVVAFFTLLALYFLVSFVWWALRKRERRLVFSRARLVDHERNALAAADAATKPGSTVRVVGRVVPLTPTDVVVRVFSAPGAQPWRLVELVEFAVVPPDGVPAVVRALTAPVLELPEQRSDFGEHAARFSDPARRLVDQRDASGSYSELVPGARVELIGSVQQTLPNADAFELDGQHYSLARPDAEIGTAYRGGPGGPALVIGRDDSPRIVIRAER